jgi:hypothetical protein
LGEGGVLGQVLVAETAEFAEVRASFFTGLSDVLGPGWDGHEAGDTERFEGLEGLEERGQVLRGEAVFGLLVGEFDFDEDGEGLAEGARDFVEAGCYAEGVDGVDGVEELGRGGGFVGLEGADEMHFKGFERGGLLGFLLPLLNSVLAEETLAGSVGFEQGFDWVDLGDGHEGDVLHGAVGAGAGFGDLGANLVEVFSN